MNHKLKIKQEYLDRLLDGTKTCELRLNDRDYQVGDSLTFLVLDFTGEWNKPSVSCVYKITHVLPVQAVIHDCNWNYAVLSLKKLEDK